MRSAESLPPRAWRWPPPAAPADPTAELSQFGELVENTEVDTLRVLVEQLMPPRRDLVVPATRPRHGSDSSQVRHRPDQDRPDSLYRAAVHIIMLADSQSFPSVAARSEGGPD